MNISDNGGHYEQRFRYTCKARIPDPSLLEVGRQRIEMRYCSSDGSTGCSTNGECRVEETGGLFPAVSASGCFCYLTPTGFLCLRRLVIGQLAKSHFLPAACVCYSLDLSSFPFQTLPLSVLQKLNECYLNQPSLSSSTLSEDQSINEPIHKADQQFTSHFSSFLHSHTLRHNTHRCMYKVTFELTHAVYPSTHRCAPQSLSQPHRL